MFCWVFIVFSRVEQVQLGLKGILMGSTGGGLAPVRRPSQNKSGPEAARRPCVGGAVAARETNGHHITMATEDLLQPGHVVKERWKVVSSAISILFCNVVFFFKVTHRQILLEVTIVETRFLWPFLTISYECYFNIISWCKTLFSCSNISCVLWKDLVNRKWCDIATAAFFSFLTCLAELDLIWGLRNPIVKKIDTGTLKNSVEPVEPQERQIGRHSTHATTPLTWRPTGDRPATTRRQTPLVGPSTAPLAIYTRNAP